MDFTEFIDLASERLGGRVLAANDEFFAPKENLLQSSKPVFLENKYTDRGKWMDGWETRRRRTPGHDWCLIKLGLAGIIRGVVVDTSHFKGNYPEHCSLEAWESPEDAGAGQLADPATAWVEILPPCALKGDTQNLFSIENPRRFTHLRFNIFPDGGVARLRVYGEVVPNWALLLSRGREIDLASVENGGLVVASSDMFFGSPHNLILPGLALNMGDGWETRRRGGPGHDWVIIKLGRAGVLRRADVDTTHYKGNYPESCSLEGDNIQAGAFCRDYEREGPWREILARTQLQPDTRHRFEKEIQDIGPVTHVRFNIFPDGGVGRLRLYGTAM